MSLRVAFMVAEGTELTECIATMDVLKRAGIECDTLGQERTITRGINHEYCLTHDFYDAVVFPGGGLGVKNVRDVVFLGSNTRYKNVKEEILKMNEQNKLIAAICAAPSILGELGLLKGKKYTCYPGFSSDSFGGEYTGEEVIRDDNIITGRSMYFSVDFGLAIVEYLLGKEKRVEIEEQVKGLKPKTRK